MPITFARVEATYVRPMQEQPIRAYYGKSETALSRALADAESEAEDLLRRIPGGRACGGTVPRAGPATQVIRSSASYTYIDNIAR